MVVHQIECQNHFFNKTSERRMDILAIAEVYSCEDFRGYAGSLHTSLAKPEASFSIRSTHSK